MIDPLKKILKKLVLNFIYKKELYKMQKKKLYVKKKSSPSIAVIVDSRLKINKNDLDFLASVFLIPIEKINFLWYKSPIVHDYPNHLGIDIHDFSLYGKINKEFSSFFNQQYDILINVYTKDSILLKFLSLKVKHDFAIGFTPVDLKLNDLVFDFHPNEIDIFSNELSKYLKIIFKK